MGPMGAPFKDFRAAGAFEFSGCLGLRGIRFTKGPPLALHFGTRPD